MLSVVFHRAQQIHDKIYDMIRYDILKMILAYALSWSGFDREIDIGS